MLCASVASEAEGYDAQPVEQHPPPVAAQPSSRSESVHHSAATLTHHQPDSLVSAPAEQAGGAMPWCEVSPGERPSSRLPPSVLACAQTPNAQVSCVSDSQAPDGRGQRAAVGPTVWRRSDRPCASATASTSRAVAVGPSPVHSATDSERARPPIGVGAVVPSGSSDPVRVFSRLLAHYQLTAAQKAARVKPTHTSYTGGSYLVPDAEMRDFYVAYARAVRGGARQRLVGRVPSTVVPFFADVDFKDAGIPSEVRALQNDPEFWQVFVQLLLSTLGTVLQCEPGQQLPTAQEVHLLYNAQSGGTHVHVPTLPLTPPSLLVIRRHMLQQLTQHERYGPLFGEPPQILEKVFDAAPYKNGGLREVGSWSVARAGRPASAPYLPPGGQVTEENAQLFSVHRFSGTSVQPVVLRAEFDTTEVPRRVRGREPRTSGPSGGASSSSSSGSATLSSEQLVLAEQLVNTVMPASEFELRAGQHGSSLQMSRGAPGYCVACEREHDSENGRLVVAQCGRLHRCAWHCFRGGAAAGVQLGSLELLGELLSCPAAMWRDQRDGGQVAACCWARDPLAYRLFAALYRRQHPLAGEQHCRQLWSEASQGRHGDGADWPGAAAAAEADAQTSERFTLLPPGIEARALPSPADSATDHQLLEEAAIAGDTGCLDLAHLRGLLPDDGARLQQAEQLDDIKREVVAYMNRHLAQVANLPRALAIYEFRNRTGQSEYVLKDRSALTQWLANCCVTLELCYERQAEGPLAALLGDTAANTSTVCVRPAELWWCAAERREVEQIVFDARHRGHFVVRGRAYFNLYRGLAVEPHHCAHLSLAEAERQCAPLLQHLREVWCRGNERYLAYLIGWLAWLVQRPGQKTGVVPVLRSRPGRGKGVVVELLKKVLGANAIFQPSNVDDLLGQFTAQVEGKLLVFLDEMVWAGSPREMGKLKQLVTEPTLRINRKNQPVYYVQNAINLLMASNEPWVVAVGAGARRFFPLQLDESVRSAHYYDALREVPPVALARVLYAVQLGDWKPWRCVPRTELLRDQQLRSMSALERWWYSLLCAPAEQYAELTVGRPLEVLFRSYTCAAGGRSPARGGPQQFLADLRRCVGNVREEHSEVLFYSGESLSMRSRSVRVLRLPTQEEARADFRAWMQDPEWPF
mmetsp:Transcript_10581/g.32540  ORF Transcript_10581/g.32540 Transcript_10581/m.32540 type:complete len:1148 (-) Transcript_10581:145-3588(-)